MAGISIIHSHQIKTWFWIWTRICTPHTWIILRMCKHVCANGIIKLLLANKHAWHLLRWYSAASLSSLELQVNAFPAPIHHPDLLPKNILSQTERQDVSELPLDCLSALMNTTRKTEIVKERLTQRICCKEIYDGNYWFSDPRNYRLSEKERGGRVNRARL